MRFAYPATMKISDAPMVQAVSQSVAGLSPRRMG